MLNVERKTASRRRRPTGVRLPRMSAPVRRQQLLETAVRLFSRRGFAGTTTREIAEKAGVTEAVIFQHFATKEDLYGAIMDFKAAESGAAQWIEEMRACAARNDDTGVVRTFVRRVLEQGTGDPQFVRLMLHSALEGHGLFRCFHAKQIRPVYEFLLAYVERRQREGAFRPGKACTMVRAMVAVPGHYVLQERLFQMPGGAGQRQVVENLAQFVLGGLRSVSRLQRARGAVAIPGRLRAQEAH